MGGLEYRLPVDRPAAALGWRGSARGLVRRRVLHPRRGADDVFDADLVRLLDDLVDAALKLGDAGMDAAPAQPEALGELRDLLRLLAGDAEIALDLAVADLRDRLHRAFEIL